MNKTLSTILSTVMYATAGSILGDTYGSGSWQFWTLVVIIFGVDMLSFARGVGEGMEIKSNRIK